VEIKQATLETCGAATDAVVVIDVIRAFTTAAHAFAAGARDVVLVGAVEEALALRENMPFDRACPERSRRAHGTPGALVMGEDGGLPVEGFDLGNSPAALLGLDLSGRRLIQRTSQGTQGVVRSAQAKTLLTASFAVANATARYLRRLSPATVTFVTTGVIPGGDGDEDVACADYIAALLRDERPDAAPFLQRVRDSASGRGLVSAARPGAPPADLACCVAVDRFDFAMRVRRRDGLLVMEAVP